VTVETAEVTVTVTGTQAPSGAVPEAAVPDAALPAGPAEAGAAESGAAEPEAGRTVTYLVEVEVEVRVVVGLVASAPSAVLASASLPATGLLVA
jgi:hypothetical protein